jgi:agmatine/peptidylarginine deiminase
MEFGHVASPPPGDFEFHAALIVSLTELLGYSPQTVVELIDAVVDRMPVVAIVQGEEQRRHAVTLLTDWGLPVHSIYFVFMPVGTWTRDFAPSFVRWTDGDVVILDAEYRFEGRANEDVVPRALASLLKVRRRAVPLVLEGGNLLSNGWGLCLTTTALVEVNRVHGRPYDAGQVRAILDEYYGFSQAVMLEPLTEHKTLHVDMFATFTAPDCVVVGACDPRAEPAAAEALDRNAEILRRVRTRGQPLRVERIPMPTFDGRLCRTYTNVVYANGRLLVPHYPDVDAGVEREVVGTYRRLLPGWEVVQIDCGPLTAGGGALRCMTAHVPWLGEAFREALAPPPGRRWRGVGV